MFYLVTAAFSTVLLSEILGDKSIYTISSLASRFHPLHVLGGVTLAFACKMLAAVLIGSTIFLLFPPAFVIGLSATSFFATGVFLLLKRSEKVSQSLQLSPHWTRSVLIPFAAIFFSEWGDIGQLTAANMVARYSAPFSIFLGGTVALMTKGVLAITLGIGLRKRIGTKTLRYGAGGLCLLMGIVSLFAS